MFSQLRPALVSMTFFTVLVGLAYPLGITSLSRALFPAQANGSIIKNAQGEAVGSALIAQAFAGPAYLHPRPSAAGKGYDGLSSSGSNYGPLNPDLAARIKTDADALRADSPAPVPIDAVTTSGSGLDPDITPANAARQAARIAAARGVDTTRVTAIIKAQTEAPVLGFIGQPRVNVLKTNLALDAAFRSAQRPAS